MLGPESGAQDFIGVVGAVNYCGVVCRDGLTFTGKLCLSSFLRGREGRGGEQQRFTAESAVS
jgi:hypothetical protein